MLCPDNSAHGSDFAVELYTWFTYILQDDLLVPRNRGINPALDNKDNVSYESTRTDIIHTVKSLI